MWDLIQLPLVGTVPVVTPAVQPTIDRLVAVGRHRHGCASARHPTLGYDAAGLAGLCQACARSGLMG